MADTAAVGMHPTGMHSCIVGKFITYREMVTAKMFIQKKNATQIRQRAHILKFKYCFNIHNAHLNLVLPILG